MSFRDKWVVDVAHTLTEVSELISVCDLYSDMDTVKQQWYRALLLRLKEDALRLREAMSSTASSHLGVESSNLGWPVHQHTPSP